MNEEKDYLSMYGYRSVIEGIKESAQKEKMTIFEFVRMLYLKYKYGE